MKHQNAAVLISFSFHVVIISILAMASLPEERAMRPEILEIDLENEVYREKDIAPNAFPETVLEAAPEPEEAEVPDYLEEPEPITHAEFSDAMTEVKPLEPLALTDASEIIPDSIRKEVSPAEPNISPEILGAPLNTTPFGGDKGGDVSSDSGGTASADGFPYLPQGNPQGNGYGIYDASQEAPVRQGYGNPASDQKISKPVFSPAHRLTKSPIFVKRIEPVYPESERAAGIEAKVVAEVYVNNAGEVEDVLIVKSGGEIFDRAVIAALRASAFQPGMMNEKPVAAKIRIPIVFKLN